MVRNPTFAIHTEAWIRILTLNNHFTELFAQVTEERRLRYIRTQHTNISALYSIHRSQISEFVALIIRIHTANTVKQAYLQPNRQHAISGKRVNQDKESCKVFGACCTTAAAAAACGGACGRPVPIGVLQKAPPRPTDPDSVSADCGFTR